MLHKNRYEFAMANIELDENIKIMDMGARDCILKNYLNRKINNFTYHGYDLFDNECIYKACNLENGSDFIADNEYDVAFALDVIEHTNNMHKSLLDIVRVSKKTIIMLPNMYYWKYRINFLLGKPLNSKYKLSKEKCYGDRHRWVFTLNEANNFLQDFCDENNCILEKTYLKYSTRREYLISSLIPSDNLSTYNMLYQIKKK